MLPSLTEGPGASFARAVGGAYEAGLPVSFPGLFAGERRRRVALPTYPFQRERYWAKTADADLEWLGGVEDLLYEVRWREAAAAPADSEAAPGPGVWVLAVPEAAPGLARDLSRALGAANQTVVAVSGEDSKGTTGTTARVEPGERESWRSALETLPANAPLRGIVHLGAAGGPGVDTGADELHRELERALASALALVQGLFDSARAPESGLWLVTRGGQVVGDERTGHPGGSALWGFGRVVARELPDLKVRMLDLDPGAPPAAKRLAGELLRPDREPQVAYRGGVRRVARLVRPAAQSGPPGGADGAPASPLARGDRTYLVTGGLTGLGLATAEWLAGRGARALLLNGRRPPGKAAEDAIRRFRNGGVAVRVELGDVAEAGTVERLLARTNGPEAVLPPLGGVIHSAGTFGVASVGNHDRALLESVLRAKVLGAWGLRRATLELELDLFLLYSSCSGVFGNAGHAAYAAASAFLDQLALHRRTLGLAGEAIAWGPWSELGASAAARVALDADVRRTGLGWLTPRQGFAALDRLAAEGAGYGVVAPVDWPAFVAAAPAARPLVEEVAPAAEDEAAESAARVAARLRGAAALEREGMLLDLVREETRSVLRLRSLPAPGAGFFDLGMDSVMAVELRNRLNRALSEALAKGGALPNTVVLDFPNPASLAENLAARLGSGAPAKAAAKTAGAGVRREYERVRRLSREDFEAEAEALLDAGEAGP